MLLIVFNINHVERRELEQGLYGMNVPGIVVASDEGTPISIWDLDKIQNGEPIPATVVQALKEVVKNAT